MSYQPKVYRKQGGDELVIAAGGKLTVEAGGILNGTNTAALVSAGLGASAAYVKTDNGVKELMAAVTGDRTVIGTIVVDEVFAAGDGAATVVTIGDAASANKFVANTLLVAAAKGAVFTFAGTIASAKNLIVTMTKATGTGTGGISVSVLVLPAAV